MKQIYVSWHDVENHTQEILRQMQLDSWIPDYVVGITRGGLVPANLISQYLECRMETLQVRLRDSKADEQCESNCWMSEDAFNGSKILIVDDVNDSGATLNWIRQDWQRSCLPNDPKWANIWGNNVRIAVLIDNETSGAELDVSYTAKTINKVNDPQWIVFPWEEWWIQ